MYERAQHRAHPPHDSTAINTIGGFRAEQGKCLAGVVHATSLKEGQPDVLPPYSPGTMPAISCFDRRPSFLLQPVIWTNGAWVVSLIAMGFAMQAIAAFPPRRQMLPDLCMV
eukprot:scaffold158008_cov17-Tisochrysis_lutea.AAC.1